MNETDKKMKPLNGPPEMSKILIAVIFLLAGLGLVWVYDRATESHPTYACGSEMNDVGRSLLKVDGLDVCPIATQKMQCQSTFLEQLKLLSDKSPEWKNMIESMNLEDPTVLRVDFAYNGASAHYEYYQQTPASPYKRIPLGLCKVSSIDSYLAMEGRG